MSRVTKLRPARASTLSTPEGDGLLPLHAVATQYVTFEPRVGTRVYFDDEAGIVDSAEPDPVYPAFLIATVQMAQGWRSLIYHHPIH